MRTRYERDTRPRLRVPAVLIAAGLAIAACGSDGDSSDSSAQSADTTAPESSDGTQAPAGSDGTSDGDIPVGDPIVLGGTMPLTGAAATLGIEWERGIELALDVVNADGGVLIDGVNYPIEVNIIDDETTPAGAQRAIQQHLDDGVKMYLGPVSSSSFDTAYGVLKDVEDRIVITPATAAEKYIGTPDGHLLFRTQSSSGGENGGYSQFADAVVAEYAPTRVAILAPQDPTGDTQVPIFTEGFEDAGVEIVYSEQFPPDTRDFAPYISAMRETNPDFVVGPYLDSVMGPFLAQAAQLDFTEPGFGSAGVSQASLAETDGKIENFTWQIVTRAVDNPDDPAVAGYRAAYEAKYGEEPPSIGYFALSFYDPLIMLAASMEAANDADDLEAIAEQLESLTTWDEQV
ncbi:MAG: ABC transporter substrate-binding protein, partial [Ilumatobacteraceae bacterium]